MQTVEHWCISARSVLAYPQRPSAYGPELLSEQMARNPRSHRNATLRPLRRWDNGRDVIVAGDAAGVVAPASGEGIYYAMECGRLAAEAADRFLVAGGTRACEPHGSGSCALMDACF
jgi:flavin-dependent dehydrogenase